LYECLERAVLRLETVGVLLVYTFTAVIRPWGVDTFGVVNLGAGRATRLIAVAFTFTLARLTV